MLRLSLSNSNATTDWWWCLNESILQKPEVLNEVVQEIKAHFQTNAIPESDPGMVWEAHKAVIRGILIKHGSHIKKAREAQLTKLLAAIQVLELQHKGSTHPIVGTELAQFRRQVSDHLRYKAKAALQSCMKIVYKYRDRCG